jgi:hypothetical protein
MKRRRLIGESALSLDASRSIAVQRGRQKNRALKDQNTVAGQVRVQRNF